MYWLEKYLGKTYPAIVIVAGTQRSGVKRIARAESIALIKKNAPKKGGIVQKTKRCKIFSMVFFIVRK